MVKDKLTIVGQTGDETTLEEMPINGGLSLKSCHIELEATGANGVVIKPTIHLPDITSSILITDEYGFIVMEFFNRGDLKQRMELDLSLEVCLSYITHIAYGLRDIHDMGVVHRDIKPANIMFRGDDSLAIADFGISKKLYSPMDMTTLGKVLGTPHYLSPEQGQGKKVDQRSDIYSLGILFFELLTREKPYTANTPAALIYQHINAPLPVLTGEKKMFQRIIKKTMAKSPGDRYQTMDGLIFDLEKIENKLT